MSCELVVFDWLVIGLGGVLGLLFACGCLAALLEFVGLFGFTFFDFVWWLVLL